MCEMFCKYVCAHVHVHARVFVLVGACVCVGMCVRVGICVWRGTGLDRFARAFVSSKQEGIDHAGKPLNQTRPRWQAHARAHENFSGELVLAAVIFFF